MSEMLTPMPAFERLTIKGSFLYLANLGLNLRPMFNKRPSQWIAGHVVLDDISHHVFGPNDSSVQSARFTHRDGSSEIIGVKTLEADLHNPFTLSIRDDVADALCELGEEFRRIHHLSLTLAERLLEHEAAMTALSTETSPALLPASIKITDNRHSA